MHVDINRMYVDTSYDALHTQSDLLDACIVIIGTYLSPWMYWHIHIYTYAHHDQTPEGPVNPYSGECLGCHD